MRVPRIWAVAVSFRVKACTATIPIWHIRTTQNDHLTLDSAKKPRCVADIRGCEISHPIRWSSNPTYSVLASFPASNETKAYGDMEQLNSSSLGLLPWRRYHLFPEYSNTLPNLPRSASASDKYQSRYELGVFPPVPRPR